MKAELFCHVNCDLAEGPVWHDGNLWWVDIEAGCLHCSNGSHHEAPFSIGAAVPCVSGHWLLAEESGLSFWNLKTPPVRIWERPTPSPDYRFNDGKVSPAGAFVAGSLKRGSLEGDCSFYQLTEEGHVDRIVADIGLCNGIDWDPGRNLFYYVDTGKSCVRVSTVGVLSDDRIFKTIENGLPDGLCLDQNGNVWLAVWGEGCVLCLESETGRLLEKIEIPVPNVTSCCFGGEALDELFITTARLGLESDQIEAYPMSGSIFSCRPGVSGVRQRLFNDLKIK